jgi:hypothetical protein
MTPERAAGYTLGLSTLNMVYNECFATIGVTTLLVGLLASCHIAFRSFSCLVLGSESTSRRVASRRSASVFEHRVVWLPWAHVRKNWILGRRRVDTLGVGLPASYFVVSLESWILSRLRDDALGRSASFCQRLVASLSSSTLFWNLDVDLPVSCVPSLSLWRYIWNHLSASRRSVLVCECRVVWRLDAPLGFIWNLSQHCDCRCRDAQLRFDNVVL